MLAKHTRLPSFEEWNECCTDELALFADEIGSSLRVSCSTISFQITQSEPMSGTPLSLSQQIDDPADQVQNKEPDAHHSESSQQARIHIALWRVSPDVVQICTSAQWSDF